MKPALPPERYLSSYAPLISTGVTGISRGIGPSGPCGTGREVAGISGFELLVLLETREPGPVLVEFLLQPGLPDLGARRSGPVDLAEPGDVRVDIRRARPQLRGPLPELRDPHDPHRRDIGRLREERKLPLHRLDRRVQGRADLGGEDIVRRIILDHHVHIAGRFHCVCLRFESSSITGRPGYLSHYPHVSCATSLVYTRPPAGTFHRPDPAPFISLPIAQITTTSQHAATFPPTPLVPYRVASLSSLLRPGTFIYLRRCPLADTTLYAMSHTGLPSSPSDRARSCIASHPSHIPAVWSNHHSSIYHPYRQHI